MLFLGSAAPGNRCRAEKGPVIFCFVQRGNLTAYMWERRNKGKNQEGAGDVQCQRTENIHEKVNRKLCRRSPSRERRKVHGRPKFIQRHQTTHQLHRNHYLASNSKQDVKKKTFPGGPAAKTLHFLCRAHRFGNSDPMCWAAWPESK